MASSVWTIIVAAGSGQRFGGPKQLAELGGRPLLDWAVKAARPASDGIVVVAAAELVEHPDVLACGADRVVAGGASRSESVRAGLASVPADAEIVAVHDAARPLATTGLFVVGIEAVRGGADGAVPSIEVVDTLRRRDGGVVDRSQLVAVQTPQVFAASALRAAHRGGTDATDDAGLVEAAGGRIALVAGERDNLKVTRPEDLMLVQAMVDAKGTAMLGDQLRVGNGFDVHRFSDDPGRPLLLGGIRFDGERGLAGHSDADVVAHACAESILGAAGLGDLGQLFPDTDDRWAGADSIELLAEAARRAAARGWTVANIDCAVIAERPKLASLKGQMQDRLSDAVGAPVTVAGRRAEGIGGLGRGEGIAAMATALLVRRSPAGPPASDAGSAAGATR